MQIIISHWHCSLKLRWQKAMHFHQLKIHASQMYEQWIFQTWTQFQCSEVRFARFLSAGFTTMAVLNPPERKLAKRTSVYCTASFYNRYLHKVKSWSSEGNLISSQHTLRSQIEGYTRLLIFRNFSPLPAVIWASLFINFQENFQPPCFFHLYKWKFFHPTHCY